MSTEENRPTLGVTVYVDEDEWYPVWSARLATIGGGTPYGDPVVVDFETAQRWRRVFEEFNAVQNEIGEAYAASRGPVAPGSGDATITPPEGTSPVDLVGMSIVADTAAGRYVGTITAARQNDDGTVTVDFQQG